MNELIRLCLLRETSISQAHPLCLHDFILIGASPLLQGLTGSRVKKLQRFFRLWRPLDHIIIKHMTFEVVIAETGLILSLKGKATCSI